VDWFHNGAWESDKYWTMQGELSLREETSLDMNSIFEDPLYVNPNQPMASWDWRIKSTSPNVGAGEGGSNIGAGEVQP
jgi:hypothetical protein